MTHDLWPSKWAAIKQTPQVARNTQKRRHLPRSENGKIPCFCHKQSDFSCFLLFLIANIFVVSPSCRSTRGKWQAWFGVLCDANTYSEMSFLIHLVWKSHFLSLGQILWIRVFWTCGSIVNQITISLVSYWLVPVHPIWSSTHQSSIAPLVFAIQRPTMSFWTRGMWGRNRWTCFWHRTCFFFLKCVDTKMNTTCRLTQCIFCDFDVCILLTWIWDDTVQTHSMRLPHQYPCPIAILMTHAVPHY